MPDDCSRGFVDGEGEGEDSGEGVEVALDNNEKSTPTDDADKQRLQALIQRGKKSDENVKNVIAAFDKILGYDH